ncbi:MAG: DUF4364 family protein, partial [Clostridiales bacterium]|nr:DUF4364 family protein [Clostridiales bacterium]
YNTMEEKFMFINPSNKETIDRLAILLVLDTFKYPIHKTELVDFILKNNIIKYFEMHELTISLIDNQLVLETTIDKKIYYTITENGRVTLEFFKDRIPIDLQNTIIDLVSITRKPSKVSHEVKTHYTKLDHENYEVYLELFENEKSLMKLSINVISENHAEQIIDKWERDSEFLYGDVIQLLTK